jgi:hypothetical protein
MGKIMGKSFENFPQPHVGTMAEGPNTMITNIFASMRQEVKLVMQKEGGITGYQYLVKKP